MKKLAAGGAIAMGGSMVLSSNAVAYAASVPEGVISGIPPAGQPLPVAIPPFTSSSGVLTITDPTQPLFNGAQSVQVSHAWRINGYELRRGNSATGLELRTGGQVIQASGRPTCTTGCGGSYFTGSDSAAVRPLGPNGQGMKFKGGDPYDIGMLVVWQVPGVQTITAEYRIVGTIGGAASVINETYQIS